MKLQDIRPTDAWIVNGSALAFAALMGVVVWALEIGHF